MALSHWANRNTEALKGARDEMFREWVVEEKQATVQHVRRLAEHAADLNELKRRLEELVSDPELARVRDNYGFEAAREAIDQRRRMLTFASVGSINLELSVVHIARVERVVRELDPSDVKLLSTLSEDWSKTSYEALERAGISGDALVSSGCVRLRDGNLWSAEADHLAYEAPDETVATVSELGRMVLVVCDPYLRAVAGQ